MMISVKLMNIKGLLTTVLAILSVFCFFIFPAACQDLAETEEILFLGDSAKDLRDKAAELSTVVNIYEYVRNNYEYVLYHGSRSSSLNTFLGGRGNDVDLSTTLIAMLRSQGIPARYVVGNVKVDSDKVMNWLGVRDLDLAVAIMDDQGIQNVTLATDRSYVEFEHVWVEAFTSYHNYRGAGIDTQTDCGSEPEKCFWISLDPSFKLKDYGEEKIDIHDAIDFDYTRYYNAIANDDAAYKDKNPIEIFETEILSYLRTNFPGKTLEDVAYTGRIIEENNLILPDSLPYEFSGMPNSYTSIADHDSVETTKWAKNVVLTVKFDDENIIAAGTIKVAQASTTRVTLSYEHGEPARVVTRLGGVEIAEPLVVGTLTINNVEVGLGYPFNLNIVMDGAPATEVGQEDEKIEVDYDKCVIGGYYLISPGGEESNWSQVHRAADELLFANAQYPVVNIPEGITPRADVDDNNNGILDDLEPRIDYDDDGWDINDPLLLGDQAAMDDLTGGLLYAAQTLYYAKLHSQINRVSSLNHVKTTHGFLGVISTVYEVEYLGNTAFSILPGGLLIDMKGIPMFNWRNNAPEDFSSKNFELCGHIGSSLEHETWQMLTGYDAVSTVRGIQMAIANNDAELLNPKKNDTVDNLPDLYATFGFTNEIPYPFQLEQFPAGDDLFGSRPLTWTNVSSEEVLIDFFKATVGPDTSDLQLIAWSLTLQAESTYYHDWVLCVNSWENYFQQLIDSGYGNDSYINHYISQPFCNGQYFSAFQTVNSAMAQLEFFYNNTLIPGIFGEDFYACFDENNSEPGFVEADYVYRHIPSSDDDYGKTIAHIRNNLYLVDSESWGEALIPSKKPSGDLFRFDVYILKTHEKVTDKLTGLSFCIWNDYGGGYVEESGGTLIPAEDTDEFNNELFTDQNLIHQVNNDTIITPSTIDPVSTVTGNMYHDETDVAIKGKGLDLVFTRTYNSGLTDKDSTEYPLSLGWTHSYNMHLKANDYTKKPNEDIPENSNGMVSSISYMDERGGEVLYPVDGDGGTWNVGMPRGVFDALELDTPSSGMHTITFRNGVKYIFEGIGGAQMRTVDDTARLKSIEDPYGNVLTLTYDGNGRLTNIDDNLPIAGRTGLTMTYYPDGRLETLSDWTGRTWTYTYVNNNLTSITNPMTQIEYTYHEDTHLLKDIILPEDRSGEQVTTTFKYYENNRAFSYHSTLGHTETMDYDLYRKRTRVTDPRGFVREHTYNEDGALVKLVEPDNGILIFENNEDGLRYKKIDALGYDTAYSYNTNRTLDGAASDTGGNVTLEQDEYEDTVEYDYDYNLYDQITRVRDKRGNERYYDYHQNTVPGTGAVRGKIKNVDAMIDAVRVTLEEYTYYDDDQDAKFGNLKQKIEYIDKDDPNRKRVTDYYYESNGMNLSQITVTGQPDGQSTTITYTYDDLGKKETETLQRRTSATDTTLISLTTTYEYDDLSRVIKVTDPIGNINETVYDENGKVYQQMVHYKGSDESYVIRTLVTNHYDSADRLIKSVDALGYETHYTYDESGNLIQVTDANNHITRYEYDAMGRQKAVIDANGHQTETVYDLAGRIVKLIDANNRSSRFEYDALGRTTKAISPMGRETQFEYDENGNVVKLIDANAVLGVQSKNSYDATVYTEYDEFNRPELVVDAEDGETRYTYDLLGNITSIEDAEHHVTDFRYDDLGRLVEVIDPIHETPEDATVSFTYDEAGNVLTTTDRKGNVTRLTYDTLNRLTLTEFLSDNTTEFRNYDRFGDMTLIGNDWISYTYTYDVMHRLTSKTEDGMSRSLEWQYDPVGNIIKKTDYQGDITEYTYDSTNRLVCEKNKDYVQVSYHYDPAGRLLNRILSNKSRTDYEYDDDNRLTRLTNVSVNGEVQSQTYGHDEVGNITSLTDASGTTTFTYFPTYRLNTADYPGTTNDRTYTYDKVGNRETENRGQGELTAVYQYNDGNHLEQITYTPQSGGVYHHYFDYDLNGNREQKRDDSGIIQTYVYDQKNRITSITTQTATHYFFYDPNDYRVKKETDQGDFLAYLLEGEHIEAVYDEDLNLRAKFLRGVVVDEIVSCYYSDEYGQRENFTFYHDHLSSVTALTDHQGNVSETTKYGPFGELIECTGNTDNFLKYTGRELDFETGLYYYRARYYDPEIGRFLNEDPLGFEAGVNFFTYANNNPINYNDPMGLIDVNKNNKVTFNDPLGMRKELKFNYSAFGNEQNSLLNFNAGTIYDPAGGTLYSEASATLGKLGYQLDKGRFSNEGQLFHWTGTAAGGTQDYTLDTKLYGAIFEGKMKSSLDLGYIDLNFRASGTLGSLGAELKVGKNGLLIGAHPLIGSSLGVDWTVNDTQSFWKDTIESGNPTMMYIDNLIDNVSGFFTSNPGNSAGGGYILYPNKANTNMMRRVYSK